ncbi:MAG: hypothetical protein ACF8PG_03085 [Maioricimonas sp. JB045]|uniref:hypothetical protein n=1 Tax=Maioricimonas sp. JC845 TaxID=3232138 RepID=UPI003459E18E
MPFEYTTIAENRVLQSRLYGSVDLADCLNLLYSLTLEQDSFDRFRAVCDTRGATASLSTDALFSLTSFVRSYKDKFAGIRWATVANTHLEFGLAQSIALMLRDLPLEYRAFRTIEEACLWQELPLAMFDEPLGLAQ